MFKLNGGIFTEIELVDDRFWIPGLELGLGVWIGNYKGVTMPWLRWYDQNGNWILTSIEKECQNTELERQKAELERQKAELERQKTERLIAQLKSLGIEPDLE
jgi:hypothetical protein